MGYGETAEGREMKGQPSPPKYNKDVVIYGIIDENMIK